LDNSVKQASENAAKAQTTAAIAAAKAEAAKAAASEAAQFSEDANTKLKKIQKISDEINYLFESRK
jgi:murein lipoprotein